MPWHWVSFVKEKLSTKEQNNIRKRVRPLSCKKLIRHSYWELFLLIKAAMGKEYQCDSLDGVNSPTTINPSRYRRPRKVEGHCLFCYNSQESWTLGFFTPRPGQVSPHRETCGGLPEQTVSRHLLFTAPVRLVEDRCLQVLIMQCSLTVLGSTDLPISKKSIGFKMHCIGYLHW